MGEQPEDRRDAARAAARARRGSLPRSDEMVLVGYFLSRMSVGDKPPPSLGVTTWKDAYSLFHRVCGDGRTETSFGNSLKNSRDAFDGHLSNDRVGWRVAHGRPLGFSAVAAAVFETWNRRSDAELVAEIQRLLAAEPSAPPTSAEALPSLRFGQVLCVGSSWHGMTTHRMSDPDRGSWAGRGPIQRRAERLVREDLRLRLGPAARSLVHHSAIGDLCGYDLSYVAAGCRRRVAVTGCEAQAVDGFSLDLQQWAAAAEARTAYDIYLVGGAGGGDPVAEIISNPLDKATSLRVDPVKWLVTRTGGSALT